MKKKLLVVSHAGVLDVNRALFRAVAALDCAEIVMIVPTEWKGDLIASLRFEASAADVKLRVIAVPVALSGKGSLFFFLRSLRRELDGWTPDVVFVFQEPWSLAAFQAFRAFPRARRYFFSAENLPKSIPWPFRRLERWIYRTAAGGFAPSAEADKVLNDKGFRGSKRLYYSYDSTLFSPLSVEQRAAARASLSVPSQVPTFAYFGRLVSEKGILDIPSALAEVLRREPALPWFFLCVGSGPLRSELTIALSVLPQNRWRLIPAAPHDGVARLIGSVDVLVLPSRTTSRWKEQFGRVLVEAMACRVAVIGSDSGEIPNLIRRSGAGSVFPEGDVVQLADRILEMLASPEELERYKAAGAHFAREQVSHQSVARKFAVDLGLLPAAELRSP